MPNLTDLTTVLGSIFVTKSASIKSDKDSKTAKKVNLRFDFNGVTLGQVIGRAVAAEVIRWQSNNRDKFDKLVDGSTITVKFAGTAIEDPETAIVAKLASMTKSEQEAYLADLAAKAQK